MNTCTYFSNRNYERRSSKLADENAKCSVVFERRYSYLPLSPAFSNIARTSVGSWKDQSAPTCLTPKTGARFIIFGMRSYSDRVCESQTSKISVPDLALADRGQESKIQNGRRKTQNARGKMSLIFYSYSKRMGGFHVLLLSAMVSVSHIYCWQVALLRFFCLSHAQGMFNLGQICQHWFRSKNLKASLISSTRALSSDKARCFSQSQCVLYRNFIIILTNKEA